ncbi:MAG: GerMN domain-containing protein [Clostridiales bacterium]|nr:GerMN domain-containing protein [Clostridiales bacterium]
MLRTIKNIILLIIICITATGMPIFANIIFAPECKEAMLPVEIAMHVSIDEIESTQYQISIKVFDKNSMLELLALPDNPVILEIYRNEQFVSNIDLKDVFKMQNSTQLQEKSIITEFVTIIDQEKTNLPDGMYQLKVIPNIKDIDSSLDTQTFSLSFDSDFKYIPSLESISRNNMGLILYFPDSEFINLIPITRVIPFTPTPLRATLNNLLAGVDKSVGLPTGSFIPEKIGLGLVNRTAQLFLPADIGRFETNSTDARIALYSLVNSLNTIHAVNRVQFYFNNRIVESGFHGHAMSKPYYHTASSLYVGTRTKTNRILLTPVPIFGEITSIETVFSQLKFNYNKEQFNFNIIPTVPAEVVLKNYTIDDGILKLDLSPAFLTVFEDNEAQQNLMIESILYTFASLPDIAQIQFDIKDTKSNTLGRYPIGEPIKPSRYINPETQN